MEFKTEPFKHQRAEVETTGNTPAWALFWEQGTGKSKPIIDTAARLYEKREIDAVLTVAPSGVHRNWIEQELPLHFPDSLRGELRAFCYQSSKSSTKRHQKALDHFLSHKGLSWLSISYDAFLTKEGYKAITHFLQHNSTLCVLDESQYIKNPLADRTKTILRWGDIPKYKRVLTGTPITQGPFDMYSQIQFLDKDFWQRHGIGSFTEFKTHFGVWKKAWNPTAYNPITKKPGREYDVLVEYRRLDELHAMLQEISSRVTKDQVLDLPPKLYTKRFFTLTAEQKRVYQELRDEFITWIALHPDESKGIAAVIGECPICGGTKERVIDSMVYPCEACPEVVPEGTVAVMAPQAMVRILRLQQVSCGYLPTQDDDEPIYLIPGANRRLDIALDICEQAQHKVIVWARFKLDLTLLEDGLRERGIKTSRYDGTLNESQRADSVARFTGSRAMYENGQVVGRSPVPEHYQSKVFLGNSAVGATGLTLVQAKTVVYYSNSFKMVDRLQSEDRAHRIGQTNEVLYIDLVGEDTVDEKIVERLREKKFIADQILGDDPKEWI